MKFLYIEDIIFEPGRRWAERLTTAMERDFEIISPDAYEPDVEADLLFIATTCSSRRVQYWLNRTRELRLPYLFLTPQMRHVEVLAEAPQPIRSILCPVTMLEEEVHKAELLSHLARYTDAQITLLTANDYGSRAKTNTQKIRTFLMSREEALTKTFQIEERTARNGSMSLYKELTDRYRDFRPDLIVQTASRDYGLDDLIFGPVERKLILRSAVPIALLNPRGDLYSLCD